MDLILTGGRVVTPSGVLDPGLVGVTGGRIALVAAGNRIPPEAGPPGAGARIIDVSGATVYPGFIDLHVHGGGGGDTIGGSTGGLERMAAFLAGHGTTGFLATTMTLPSVMIESALAAADRFRRTRDGRGARLLGVHLEGPFINPTRKGAQPAEFVRRPSAEEAARLIDAYPGLVRLMTLAPELEGGLELVRLLRQRGIIAAIGHSDATYAEARAAFEAGVSHATHTYSAMRGLHHREPGTVGAVLLEPSVTAEIIADGVHAHPAAVELLIRLKSSRRVALVTDAITVAGYPDGAYEVMGLSLRVERGAAFLADGETLAGSTLTLAGAVGRVIDFAAATPVEAAEMASLTPARILGLDREIGSIEAGKAADLAVLDRRGEPLITVIGGAVVWEAGR